MKYNVGDKVIVTKSISGVFKQKAIIKRINHELKFYYVELLEGKTISGGIGCNIFQHSSEYIELDLQETRNDKLKEILK